MEGLPLASKHNGGPPLENNRVQAMDSDQQERLINWGYAICDAPLRAISIPQNSVLQSARHAFDIRSVTDCESGN